VPGERFSTKRPDTFTQTVPSPNFNPLAVRRRTIHNTPLGTPAHECFLWPRPGSGQSPDYANASPQLLVRFCQTPLRPLLALDRFPGCHDLSYPAGACCQTTVSSDGSPPRAANNSEHVSLVVLPSSPAVAANSSATNSQSSAGVPADATDSPSCKPAHSIPAVPGLSGNDDNSVAASSPLAFPL
jgi:hypothetical protein